MDYFVTVNSADYHGNVISFYFCACEETKVIKAGFFHFSQNWITNLLTHRQIEIQTLSDKTAQMCMLAWSFAARISDIFHELTLKF